MKPMNLAILIGNGSRLPAILKGIEHYKNINIAAVISHKRESLGVDLAQSKGILSLYFRITDFYKIQTGLNSKELSQETKKILRYRYMGELVKILQKEKVDLVLMSGWDILLTQNFINAFPNKIINIHPSLLPAFPGENAWIQALEYGVKITGVTIHLVTDEGMDTGPILVQKAVEIVSNETIETLRQKLNEIEDKLTIRTLKKIVKKQNALLAVNEYVILKSFR